MTKTPHPGTISPVRPDSKGPKWKILQVQGDLQAFLSRHRWSLPLALVAAGFFVRLAVELHENELAPFDAKVARMVGSQRGHWDGVMLGLTRLGDGETLLMITLASLAFLAWKQRKREASFLAAATSGTLLLSVLLKLAFQRPRPGPDLLYLVTTPASFSFPSGHALGSTGVLLSLVIVARALGVRGWYLVATTASALGVIAGIATSRVYFGVHFPSDVLGGLLAGAAWVSGLTGWFYPRLLPGEHPRLLPRRPRREETTPPPRVS
jgi:undecaprenyl-diphosphatase